MPKIMTMAAIVMLATSARGAATDLAKEAIPLTRPETWIGVDDFPAEAVRNGWEGTAQIAWAIGRDGRVANCHIVRSSGHEILDQASCKLVTERGRYSPARGRDGQPVENKGSRTIVWKQPDPGSSGRRSAGGLISSTELVFAVDGNDKLQSCAVSRQDLFSPLSSTACPKPSPRIDVLLKYLRGKGLKGPVEVHDGGYVVMDEELHKELRAKRISNASGWRESSGAFATVQLGNDGKVLSCKVDEERRAGDLTRPICALPALLPMSLPGPDGKPFRPSTIFLGNWTQVRPRGQ